MFRTLATLSAATLALTIAAPVAQAANTTQGNKTQGNKTQGNTTQARTQTVGEYTRHLNVIASTDTRVGSQDLSGWFTLRQDNTVTVNLGCNTATAPIRSWHGNKITLGHARMTQMVCVGHPGRADALLSQLLSSPLEYNLQGSNFILKTAANTNVVFSTKETLASPGAYYYLDTMRSSAELLKGATVKAHYIVDGEFVHGFTGCREFKGRVDGPEGAIAWDLKFVNDDVCVGHAGNVESRFLNALRIPKNVHDLNPGRFVFSK